MTNNKQPLSLVTELDHARAKVKDLLEDVLDQGYEDVLVIGIKGGKAIMEHSVKGDRIATLGMIEMLKFNLHRDIFGT